MPTFRKERMNEAIREVVTQKLLRDQAIIPRALVTINRVDVSKDFGVAKIFYSFFGGDVDEGEAASRMNERKADFRHEISQRLNLRRTPKVEFCFDRNTAYAFKIDEILKGSDNK